MSFVNPLLLLGALLFAVPLIIHLLNRQRYKRRDWAAMEFLLAAFKKQRRRVRTENLLLLLLRCLIPIVVAFGIARPMMRDALLTPALGGSSHHVLVFDESYSMGYRPQGAETPFARAKEMAGRLLDRLEHDSGAIATLVLAGIRTEIPISEEANLARVKAKVASLTVPQDSAADLLEAFSQVADLLDTATQRDTVVYVFTDMQARAFGPPEEANAAATPPTAPEAETPEDKEAMFADTARDLLQRIGQHAKVVILDVGTTARDAAPARADNVQIVDLRLDTPVAVAHTPVSVVAKLENRSERSASVEVTLEVDEDEPMRRNVRLEAGGEGEAEFTIEFRDVGPRRLHATTDGDGLAADDQRFCITQARSRVRLLLVEGSTETDPGLMETELLRAVLDPTRGEGPADVTVFAPKIIDTIALLAGREELRDYDVVVLANVERLNETAATAIKEAMLGGTGLLVMLGDRTDPASFNLHLHGGGNGPMPMQLTRAVGFQPGGQQYFESSLLRPEHPVFAGFVQDVYLEAFQLTPVYRFIGATDVSERGDVLARLRDADQSPLLVASSYGAGKALFVTSAITGRPERWNRLDLLMLAMPLFHETVRWLALPSDDPFNVLAGGELTSLLRERPADVAVLLPERAGGGKVLVAEESRVVAGGRHALPPYRQTEFAGVYTVEMQTDSGSGPRPHREYFAVNPDPEEGDLTYLSHDAARRQLAVSAVLRDLPTTSAGPIESGLRDLGLPLLYLALGIVVAEACLARFVSRRRGA